MIKALWLAVTPDKYELPIAVADSAGSLARILKVPEYRVQNNWYKRSSGKYNGQKIIRIEIEQEDHY